MKYDLATVKTGFRGVPVASGLPDGRFTELVVGLKVRLAVYVAA
jgi:hypothetical protein